MVLHLRRLLASCLSGRMCYAAPMIAQDLLWGVVALRELRYISILGDPVAVPGPHQPGSRLWWLRLNAMDNFLVYLTGSTITRWGLFNIALNHLATILLESKNASTLYRSLKCRVWWFRILQTAATQLCILISWCFVYQTGYLYLNNFDGISVRRLQHGLELRKGCNEEDRCIICLEDNQTDELLSFCLNLNCHPFHRDCLQSYIDSGGAKCPVGCGPLRLCQLTPLDMIKSFLYSRGGMFFITKSLFFSLGVFSTVFVDRILVDDRMWESRIQALAKQILMSSYENKK